MLSQPSLFPSQNDDDLPTKVRTADTFDNEYRYYSKIIQDLTVMLTKQEDKKAVLPWVHKLSSPAYNVTKLRDKRNRYMLMLCISLLTDSLNGPFTGLPPVGILSDITKITRPEIVLFEWEGDTTWQDELKILKEIEESEKPEEPKTPGNTKDTVGKGLNRFFKRSNCPVHAIRCPPQSNEYRKLGELLDKQFQYLLWMVKPYVAMLLRSSDRLRASKWIQTLCAIDETFCTLGKGIRNDYIVVMSGHLINQELTGVFEDYPLNRLLPIDELAKIRSEKKPITDPTHPRTEEFFMNVPHPDEGAFALVAITGDLYERKFK